MTDPVEPVLGPPGGAADWWRTGVIYQVYPRSFADSDGDGVGDLAGILDHLDHLGPAGLGVDALWLSPIYPSPGRDVGYDVSDHARIDPLFGTEADFDRLVAECHRRGIRVVLDLVMNHTSDEHAWFQASKASRDGPFADFYLWRDPAGFDPAGRPIPPNNWVSYFGGPGWEWVPERGQFYYHTFLVGQPELNWRQPAVEAAQWAMVRGWLERGVDGFRLDVFNAFLKHPDLPDNPVQEGDSPWNRLVHRHDIDQPEFPDLIRRFRAILDERPDRMSVGELFYGTTEQAALYSEDRHVVFDWSLVGTSWSAQSLGAAIDRREAAFGPDRWPTALFSNHDQPRQVTRFVPPGAGPAEQDAIARAAAVVLLTIRGTAFLYYGEELGLADVEIDLEDSIDPPARLAGPDFPWYDRSRCRTPMPWTDGPHGGFTTGRPWLPLGPDVATRNVAAQTADPDSVLAAYRRLLAARRALAPLHRGDLRRLTTDGGDVLAWTRSAAGETVLVVVNFGAEAAAPRLEGLDPENRWEPVVGSERNLGPGFAGAGPVVLRGREAVVYRPVG